MAKQSYIKSLFSNFAAAGKKSLSVELYSHLPYDLEAFYKINPSFCSITWAHGDLSNFDGLSTIALCRKLNQNSTNVIMHVGGKKFNRVEALTTFQKMKEMGVKHILAIRGGKCVQATVTGFRKSGMDSINPDAFQDRMFEPAETSNRLMGGENTSVIKNLKTTHRQLTSPPRTPAVNFFVYSPE
ncbi:Methylenetetrahydrofolate reductase [Popillia japonica]|uniref:Methylenetetrahydrofolate reductase n=1 Tax=Popillia japonica TaxID=7064 RepID=A0AAW1IYX4_POPJA